MHKLIQHVNNLSIIKTSWVGILDRPTLFADNVTVFWEVDGGRRAGVNLVEQTVIDSRCYVSLNVKYFVIAIGLRDLSACNVRREPKRTCYVKFIEVYV